MNWFALLVILLIGLITDWGNALWALAGYLLAFIVIGLTNGRVLKGGWW